MTDQKKKPEEDEVGDDELESVSGGATISERTQVVMDNIAGQTSAVKGAVGGLSMANEMMNQITDLLAEVEGEAQKDEGGSTRKGG